MEQRIILKFPRELINPNYLPYNNYLDKYTDTTIYFLTWGITQGKRARENSLYQTLMDDSLDLFYKHHSSRTESYGYLVLYLSFNDLVQSQFPFWDTGKAWYWRFLASMVRSWCFYIFLFQM